MATCASCGQENPEIARFCLACGASLEQAPAPSEERKLVTGVFVDVVGSTARSEELDPEDVRALIAPYHAAVRGELTRFGGTVEKFIGDAVFALFGAPVQHEDDPERAVRAALAARDAIRGLNAQNEWLDLHIRIGVTTGEALIMLDAKPAEGEWMAAGDVVNTAARIQSGAPVDGILVGQLTYEATQHAIDYRDAEPVQGKGKALPIAVWEAAGLRSSPAPRRTRLPLHGRSAERDALLSTWELVLAEERPALSLVVAAPGVGKTRLLDDVALHLAKTAAVHWGRCLSYGEGITYWPVREVVRSAAGILQTDDAVAVARKVGTLLESLPTEDLAELRTIAAAVSNLVGAPTTPRGTHAATEIGRAELHWGLRRLFELLASFRPLALVLEDLHWAEPTLLELLRFITAGHGPMLLLGSARPELRVAAPEFTAAGEPCLELETLDEETSADLLTELLEGTDVPAETVSTLLRNAGGNPLFLEEIAQMIQSAEGEPGDVALPTSLRALIGARLDQLPTDEKGVAQNASVIGTVFWPGAVAHVGNVAPVEPRLVELERRDIVREQLESSVAGEREFAFKHILLRDVAYERLPKGRRAALHERCAGWLGAIPGHEQDFIEIVAYHLEQACRLAREVIQSPIAPPVDAAVAALIGAAEKAERREGLREAERFYTRALEIAVDERALLDLRLRRGRSLVALGELRNAEELLATVAQDALVLRAGDVRCAALIALANIEYKRGSAAAARTHLDEAARLAAETGDVQLRIRTEFESAQVSELEGSAARAVDDLRSALVLADEIGDRALRTEGRLRLGTVLHNLCRLTEAQAELKACAALATELGSYRDEARAAVLLGLTEYYLGELETAEARALQALEWLERIADQFFQLQNALLLGMLALAREEPVLAEERLRYGLPPALESGGWLPIVIYHYLVQALIQQDKLDDARELVEFAARSLEPQDVFGKAHVLLAQAALATAEENREAALRLFDEGLALLDVQGVPLDLAEARLARARAARTLGDPDGAAADLAVVREMLTGIEATGLLRQLEGELAELAGGAGTAGSARR